VTIAGPDDASNAPYVNAVYDAVQRNVAGIMVIGWGGDEVVSAVDAAVEKGIPVVTVDSDIPQSTRLAHVGTDWFRMGAGMADELCKRIGGSGKILMIGLVDLANMQTGFRGFRQQIEKYPEIEIVGLEDDLAAGSDRAEAIVAEYLSKHPDLAGVAGFDGNSGPGAALALERLSLADKVKLVCVDADAPQREHLRRGTIDAAFCQKREMFTCLAFQLLYSFHHGSEITGFTPGNINMFGNIDIGYVVVSKDNVDSFDRELSLDEPFKYYEILQKLYLINSMIENVQELTLATDENAQIVFANPATHRLCGLEGRRIVGLPLDTLFHLTGEQKSEVRQCLEGKVAVNFETTATRRDGSSFPVHVSVSPLKTATTVRGLVVVAVNVAERKKAEGALRESEERFRELAEMLPETVFEADAMGRLRFANRKAFDHFGYSQEDFDQGLDALDMLVPEDRERAVGNIGKVLNGEKIGLNEYAALRKDGTTFPIMLHSSPITREGEPIGLRGLIVDITETKHVEAQLQRAQKMEAIGTLAGGIAHDFNNLLMGIQGRTSLMLADADSSDASYEHLKGIEDYVRSAADLTAQLLGLARGGKYELKPTDLSEVVRNQVRMFGRTKKEVAVHEKYQPDLWTAEVDRGQIDQVLLNLLVNAWQAMPNGGDLFVRTENITVDRLHEKTVEMRPGKYVRISVTDTGIGMDKEIQRKIFDPFFTTKEMGRGTGLGLASAYGIVKNHGGYLTVTSEKGEGATFRVYLPPSEKPAEREREVRDEVSHGGGTVLLVDDESMIIDVGEQMIQRLGYDVLTATNGKQALEIFREDQEKIDLVVLDMIMPEMNGQDTYQMLKKTKPDVKVLLSSGYTANRHASAILEEGSNGFIQKPFSMGELSRKIDEVLASSKSG
jgi:PAS domain S-box-containing protein